MFNFKKAYLKQKESSGRELISQKQKKKKKKHGRPKLLPEEIMKETIRTINSLRLQSAFISYNIINAIAKGKGIAIASERTMLVENGGHSIFTLNQARNVFNEITQSEREMTVANGNDFENSYLPENAERIVVYI